jgi:hypothetical protein
VHVAANGRLPLGRPQVSCAHHRPTTQHTVGVTRPCGGTQYNGTQVVLRLLRPMAGGGCGAQGAAARFAVCRHGAPVLLRLLPVRRAAHQPGHVLASSLQLHAEVQAAVQLGHRGASGQHRRRRRREARQAQGPRQRHSSWQGARGGHGGGTAIKKWRIVRLRFGTW